MTRMQRNFIIGLAAFFVMFKTMTSYAAVESTGEINVVGDEQGRVPASSTVTLIVTLVIDRSRAEPGEDIKTIEIILPNGFTVQPSDLKSVSRNGQGVDASAEGGAGGGQPDHRSGKPHEALRFHVTTVP